MPTAQPRSTARRTTLAGVLTVLLLTGSLAAPALSVEAVGIQPSSQVTVLDAPDTATPGTTVEVHAEATADMAVSNTAVLRVYDTQTGDVICEDTGAMPATLSCTGQVQMPSRDLHVQATLSLQQGSELDYQTHTVAAQSTSGTDRTGQSGETTTPDRGTDGNGTAPDTDDVDEQAIVDGVVAGVEDAFTSALDGFTDDLHSAVADALFSSFFELFTRLVKMLATMMTATPDVQGNQAVTELHQRTLSIATGMAVIAVLYSGIAYMTGGTLTGASPYQARRLLPRIIVGVTFAVLSLPLLQYTVEAANALAVAFAPNLDSATFEEYMVTSNALGIAIIVNATGLLATVVAFVIRDAYILFTAAASPLIAVAWTLPGPRRYVQPLISGYWAALVMGPAAALVLRFTYTLARTGGGTSGMDAVANWVISLAAFTLILIIPIQIYAGYSGVAGSATMISSRITRSIQRTVHRHRTTMHTPETTGYSDAQVRPSTNSGSRGSPPDREYVEQSNWYYRTGPDRFRNTEPADSSALLPPSLQDDEGGDN